MACTVPLALLHYYSIARRVRTVQCGQVASEQLESALEERHFGWEISPQTFLCDLLQWSYGQSYCDAGYDGYCLTEFFTQLYVHPLTKYQVHRLYMHRGGRRRSRLDKALRLPSNYTAIVLFALIRCGMLQFVP